MTREAGFVAWQPVLTDHQAYTLQELARQSGAPMVAYVMRLEDRARQAQGWADTQVKTIERRLIPQVGGLRYSWRQLRAHRRHVHLFCSPFDRIPMMLTLLMAVLLGVEFYLVSEPYSPATEGYLDDTGGFNARVKTLLRPLAYRCYAVLIRRRTSGIFAISSLAVVQYQRAGVPATKLFPFGYFVPQTPGNDSATPPDTATATSLRLVFVGSLIRRKGIDLLIAAVRRVVADGHTVSLDVFGSGTVDASSPPAPAVRHLGLIPFGRTQGVISRYDALILPSRHDGWGVVVNEALCAGVPVLCSSNVGAKALIERFGAGATFTAHSESAIRSSIESLARDAAALKSMKQAAADAAAMIQPSEAARYMLSVIRAAREAKSLVPSPWYGAAR